MQVTAPGSSLNAVLAAGMQYLLAFGCTGLCQSEMHLQGVHLSSASVLCVAERAAAAGARMMCWVVQLS